jgi:hypothetical protein
MRSSAAEIVRIAECISECTALHKAMKNFVDEHANFESECVIASVILDIGKSDSLSKAAEVPIRHKIFTMESALMWALFLNVAPEVAAKTENEPQAPKLDRFSLRALFALIAKVYDRGVKEIISQYFTPDDDEEV